jgi:hypothetical protein
MYVPRVSLHKFIRTCFIPGTDVMIFKIFSPKISAKKLAFLTQNKAKICEILIITLVFEKNANFFAENFRKSPKIVIITSTPDLRIVRIFVITEKKPKSFRTPEKPPLSAFSGTYIHTYVHTYTAYTSLSANAPTDEDVR